MIGKSARGIRAILAEIWRDTMSAGAVTAWSVIETGSLRDEAARSASVLGHNFPDSPWYKDAYTLLESGGLQPREDRGSYISRLFNGFTRAVTGFVR